ncbi:MAG: ferrichrome ABC transporter permease [Deltaproteobacteria bacterium]|nr:ferrichrome ABC transporter permease [Deltaproteobacteria bacterium]
MAGYLLSIFAGAYLLFQVQPMEAKAILPWFGGTPAVWTTCMLFFQVLLLAGYAYAHGLADRLGSRTQAWVHIGVLGASLVLVAWQAVSWGAPGVPPDSMKPAPGSTPVIEIIRVLGLTVGPSYLVLASTSPLLQSWFGRTWPDRSPYRLYSLSNAGSLLGLFSYPILVEPFMGLRAQGWVWSITFVILFASGVLAAAAGLKTNGRTEQSAGPPTDRPDEAPNPGSLARLMWILLPTCASALFLAVTNQLCQEVAVIPFLWVLPLGIYLLSFIFAFAGNRWYSRRIFIPALVAGTLTAAGFLYLTYDVSIASQIAIYSLVLFIACMVCHGELARMRPARRYLTSFYLFVAAGGAVGGVLVALVAPIVFDGYFELHASLWICSLVAAFIWVKGASPVRGKTFAVVIGVAAWLALLGGILWMSRADYTRDARFLARNFYGVLRVVEVDPKDPTRSRFRLMHGGIAHGYQFRSKSLAALPTCYYGPQSGVGRILSDHREPMQVGVIGLGIGTVAAYGRQRDIYRFYEINPDVIRLARGHGGFFHYLSDSRATVKVVEGDARISLEREAAAGASHRFDVLVLDAFTSDAIPTHLLTIEAFRLYMGQLKNPGGLLAVHITNKSLDLRPVVFAAADALGLSAGVVESRGAGIVTRYSMWVIVGRSAQDLASLSGVMSRANDFKRLSRPWTDRYSNLFELLRW